MSPDVPTPEDPQPTGAEGPWALSLEQWRRRTASSDPTPGGGSNAAVAAVLGCSLIQMALAVAADGGAEVAEPSAEAARLADAMAPAVAGDMSAFASLMSAYRAPRDDEAQRTERRRQITERSVAANRVTHRGSSSRPRSPSPRSPSPASGSSSTRVWRASRAATPGAACPAWSR